MDIGAVKRLQPLDGGLQKWFYKIACKKESQMEPKYAAKDELEVKPCGTESKVAIGEALPHQDGGNIASGSGAYTMSATDFLAQLGSGPLNCLVPGEGDEKKPASPRT
jgi:hypothetical protein